MQVPTLLCFVASVLGHGNMLHPTPRGNAQFNGYCSRGWDCNTACDMGKDQSPFHEPTYPKKVVRRGERMEVAWLRQNHPGGFVRVAFAPMQASDDAAAFVPAKFSCYESHCREDHHDDFLGPLNGPGFGQCWTDVIVPTHLPDGPVTLQWTWFGGGVLFADQNASFANFVSCSDIIVEGGAPQTGVAPASFEGGDPANPGANQCRYWSSNAVGVCPNGAEKKEACGYGPPRNGVPAGF